MNAAVETSATTNWSPPLARVDGFALCTAAEALLKGFLETDFDFHAIFTVRRAPFEGVLRAAELDLNREILERNGVRVVGVHDSGRAIELAAQEAARGRRVAVLIPNDELDGVVLALAQLCESALGESAAICVVMEDNPFAVETTCPRRVCRRTGLTAVEPCDVGGLRDGCDAALRLSRATKRPSALIVHVSILRSGATLLASPNRHVARIDHQAWLRRRQAPRLADVADPLRIIRGLELNRLDHLPSPGEREQYGFLAIGASVVTVRHMLDELTMAGRVPVLCLTVTEPMDAAAVARLLERCNHVILVEARPGSVAPRIVAIAEEMRGEGKACAQVWWNAMPPAAGDVEPLGINDGLRTSQLTRRVVKLMHDMRPGLHLYERLAHIPAWVSSIKLPRRSANYGVSSAFEIVGECIENAAAIVAQRVYPDLLRRAIIESRQAAPVTDVVCTVEAWDSRRFMREGAGVVRQAADERDPRLIVVCDFGEEGTVDIERLARASSSPAVESQLAVTRVDINDREALCLGMVTAAEGVGLTIMIARDGPPPRRDMAALDRTAREIDRDGFLRFQRFILPADNSCELRDPDLATQFARGLLRGSDPLRAEPLVVRSKLLEGRRAYFHLELLLEQVEIIRTRPPSGLDRLRESVRLTPPRPLHAEQGMWRVHLAGFRGDAPGVAGQLLAEAGRKMGFRVDWTHLGVALGPGRRAWSQLVFTRIDDDMHARVRDGLSTAPQDFPRFTTQIPYGEADLVLGIDPIETIRAIATDAQLRVAEPLRTAIVANSSPLEDQIDEDAQILAYRLQDVVEATTHPDRRLIMDITAQARETFLTDRQCDLIALGAAFQRGFIPVSIEALEDSARRMEHRGYAHSFEAIQLGRRIAGDPEQPQAVAQFVTETSSATEQTARLARRISAGRQRQGRGTRGRSRRFRQALSSALQHLSSLWATRHGRQALRDFATAMARCETWGGFEYAAQYAACIVDLHSADESQGDGELARLLILPMAECFLIRDLWYVGALTTSADQNHRIRTTLGVRLARGDEIRRRYLHRCEIHLASWRWVVEFRSSDWPDQILRTTLPFIPLGLRGNIQSRALRETMLSLLARAAVKTSRRTAWIEFARRLHDAAIDGSIRKMTTQEVEKFAVDYGALSAPINVSRESARQQH